MLASGSRPSRSKRTAAYEIRTSMPPHRGAQERCEQRGGSGPEIHRHRVAPADIDDKAPILDAARVGVDLE